MVIEMVDGEPPLFSCRPMEAMKYIRENSSPQLRHPEKVQYTLPARSTVEVCDSRQLQYTRLLEVLLKCVILDSYSTHAC